MKKERFASKYRTWIQAAWFALTNGYLRGYATGKIYTGNTKVLCVPGLNCYSCPGAMGACPIGSLQAVLGSNTYRISLYVFGMISLFGVLLGRVVCGFLCPFGLVQDLIYKIPFGPKKKNLPGHKILSRLRYVILILFVILLSSLVKDVTGTGSPWFCEWICPSGTLLGGIPLLIKNPEFRAAIGFRFWWKFAILILLLIASLIYYRPFCKYLCPLGAIYGVFNPVSTFRLKVDPEKCVKCGACQKACGMDIRTFETPNSPDCIRCMKCVSACPAGALDSTWAIAGRSFAEKHLTKDEPAIPNPEVPRTVLLAACLVLPFAANLLVLVLLGFYSPLNLSFRGTYDSLRTATVLLMSFAKSLVAVYMILTGIRLFLNRNDANAACRVKEATGLALKFYLFCVVLFVIACVINVLVLAYWLSPMLVSFFTPLGLPILHAYAKQLDRIIRGEKKPGFVWYLTAIITVLLSLAGVGILFVGALIK